MHIDYGIYLFALIFIFLIKLTEEEGVDLSDKKSFECNSSFEDCSGHGICSKDKEECICFEGYQTYFTSIDDYMNNKPRCNYKSKQQLYALIFAFFISFGSVYFYLGRYILGSLQLIIFSIIFCTNAYLVSKLSIKHLKKLERNEIKKSFKLILILVLFMVIFIFWYIFDLFMVYFNIYKDSNNAKLESVFPNYD
ncbi:MAG: DUF4149 domain-containing protein [archaeon]|nr:DUF4149 domain-containing protein [archaeon]